MSERKCSWGQVLKCITSLIRLRVQLQLGSPCHKTVAHINLIDSAGWKRLRAQLYDYVFVSQKIVNAVLRSKSVVSLRVPRGCSKSNLRKMTVFVME